MNQYKVGDLVDLNDVLIVADLGDNAHILGADTTLQVDRVNGEMLLVHDHFDNFGHFAVNCAEVSPALMTAF